MPIDLPAEMETELRKCLHYSLDDANFALYALVDFKAEDLQKICAMAKSIFIQNVLEMPEYEVNDFLFPGLGWDFLLQKNSGQILEYHINHLDKGWGNYEGANEGEIQWWPFDLVVVASKNWQSDGLILVHCEYSRRSGQFTVDSCRMDVENIGLSLTRPQYR